MKSIKFTFDNQDVLNRFITGVFNIPNMHGVTMDVEEEPTKTPEEDDNFKKNWKGDCDDCENVDENDRKRCIECSVVNHSNFSPKLYNPERHTSPTLKCDQEYCNHRERSTCNGCPALVGKKVDTATPDGMRCGLKFCKHPDRALCDGCHELKKDE